MARRATSLRRGFLLDKRLYLKNYTANFVETCIVYAVVHYTHRKKACVPQEAIPCATAVLRLPVVHSVETCQLQVQ